MNASASYTAATWGFGAALLLFVALVARVKPDRMREMGARALCVSSLTTVLWAVLGLAYALTLNQAFWPFWRMADLARGAAWLAFLFMLLEPGDPPQTSVRSWRRRIIGAIVLVSLVALGTAFPGQPVDQPAAREFGSRLGLLVSLALTIGGLVAVEQLARNAASDRRWSLRPMLFGIGGMFAFDLYVYTDAVLFGQLKATAWSAQGAVVACTAPLVAITVGRTWRLSRFYVSHQLVFHSTALLGVAVYLIGVGALGYFVRIAGGTWGTSIQLGLFAGALMVLGMVLTSGTLRSKLRVVLTKHLLERRFDYREEWLRLTRLLFTPGTGPDIYDRCAMALADIVESPAGAVWLKREGAYRQVGCWNAPRVTAVEASDTALVEFLSRTGWVIDLAELKRAPALYKHLALPNWLAQSESAWLVVPLATREAVIGFAVLMAPRVAFDMNWEVRDLLKTAGAQVAAMLGQIEANAALLEAEKFASFNRMSAFVVHDLKNLVSQLSLLLHNAEPHLDNPEFQHDVIDTVRHVANRMMEMVARLRGATRPLADAARVDLANVVRRACEGKRDQYPTLRCAADEPVYAIADADRLERVLSHCVQNAIDATRIDDGVSVALTTEGDAAVIEVRDRGIGMTMDFVRHRLFRPFQTTKDNGMGIGVYETYQYVTSLGGQVSVESAPSEGTRLRIVLPRATPAVPALPQAKEAV